MENILLRIRNYIISFNFGLAVNLGFFFGAYPLDKFGENPDVDTDAVPEDITEIGGLYNWINKGDPAAIDTASSSSALDVGILMSINGILDPENDDGNTTGYFELDGQNKVLIYDNPELTGDPIKLWRSDRGANEADEGNDLNGDVYVYIDTAITAGVPDDQSQVRLKITNGNNQTLMAVYTIRPKRVGFLFRGEIGMSRAQTAGFARCAYYSRRYGKVFKVKKRVDLSNSGTSTYSDKRIFPDIIPGLTDIRLTVESVSANNTGVFGTFDILELNEKWFPKRYLKSIGQPGYEDS